MIPNHTIRSGLSFEVFDLTQNIQTMIIMNLICQWGKRVNTAHSYRVSSANKSIRILLKIKFSQPQLRMNNVRCSK